MRSRLPRPFIRRIGKQYSGAVIFEQKSRFKGNKLVTDNFNPVLLKGYGFCSMTGERFMVYSRPTRIILWAWLQAQGQYYRYLTLRFFITLGWSPKKRPLTFHKGRNPARRNNR